MLKIKPEGNLKILLIRAAIIALITGITTSLTLLSLSFITIVAFMMVRNFIDISICP